MSVCVTVRTNKAVAPDDFLKKLAESGEQIVVTSKEFPSVKFGNHQTALRGIEVNQEEDGLEVRVCFVCFGRRLSAFCQDDSCSAEVDRRQGL